MCATCELWAKLLEFDFACMSDEENHHSREEQVEELSQPLSIFKNPKSGGKHNCAVY